MKKIATILLLAISLNATTVKEIKARYQRQINWAINHPSDYNMPIQKRVSLLKSKRDKEIRELRNRIANTKKAEKSRKRKLSRYESLERENQKLKSAVANMDIKLIAKVSKTDIQNLPSFSTSCNKYEDIKVRENGNTLECFISKDNYISFLETQLNNNNTRVKDAR